MSESKQNEIPVVEPGVTYNFNDFETLKKFMFDFMCSFITMEQSHDFAVSYEEFQKRLDICSQCDMFNKEKMKCEQCGKVAPEDYSPWSTKYAPHEVV